MIVDRLTSALASLRIARDFAGDVGSASRKRNILEPLKRADEKIKAAIVELPSMAELNQLRAAFDPFDDHIALNDMQYVSLDKDQYEGLCSAKAILSRIFELEIEQAEEE